MKPSGSEKDYGEKGKFSFTGNEATHCYEGKEKRKVEKGDSTCFVGKDVIHQMYI